MGGGVPGRALEDAVQQHELMTTSRLLPVEERREMRQYLEEQMGLKVTVP